MTPAWPPFRPACPSPLPGLAQPPTSSAMPSHRRPRSEPKPPIPTTTTIPPPTGAPSPRWPSPVQHRTPTASTATCPLPSGAYKPWRPGLIRIPDAVKHPTPLVQSSAMAAVRHPITAHRPLLPTRIVSEGLLSDAQLESVVLAGGSTFPPSFHLVPHRIRLGDRPSLVGQHGRRSGRLCRHHRRHGRDLRRPDPVPARLDARRRHRLRQGPRGRRDHPRQLAERAHPLPLALRVRQAPRRRPPRLDGNRRPRERCRPGLEIPPGSPGPAQGRRPLLDLRHPPLAFAPGQAVPPRADRRMARGQPRRSRPPCLRRRHRVRRVPCHGQCCRRQGQSRGHKTVPAGPCRPAPAERAPERAHRLRLRHRRQHRARPRLCIPPRPLGRRRDAPSPSAPSSWPRWKPEASPPWKSSPGT